MQKNISGAKNLGLASIVFSIVLLATYRCGSWIRQTKRYVAKISVPKGDLRNAAS